MTVFDTLQSIKQPYPGVFIRGVAVSVYALTGIV